MMKISDESYERVENILEDIGYACEVEDEFEEWEDVARPSFETFLDDLDTEQFDMTCEAIIERINDEDNENYAKGIRAAFVGYLEERLDYLAVTDDEDDPELLRYVEVIRKRLDNAKKTMLD